MSPGGPRALRLLAALLLPTSPLLQAVSDNGYSASPDATIGVRSRVHPTRDLHHDVAICGDHILERCRHPDKRRHGTIARAIPGAKMRRQPGPCLVTGKGQLPPVPVGTENEDRHARKVAAAPLPNDCRRRRTHGLDQVSRHKAVSRPGRSGTRKAGPRQHDRPPQRVRSCFALSLGTRRRQGMAASSMTTR